MSTLLHKKEVKIRKRQVCQGCGKKIEIGETVTLSTCVDSGDIWNIYECGECREWFENKCSTCQNFETCLGENYQVGIIKERQKENLCAG